VSLSKTLLRPAPHPLFACADRKVEEIGEWAFASLFSVPYFCHFSLIADRNPLKPTPSREAGTVSATDRSLAKVASRDLFANRMTMIEERK
jgi:hypothetical protein